MQKQGQGIETLGTVLAVSGWSLAALTVVLFAQAFREMVRFSDSMMLPVLLSLAISVVVCLALAGVGHLLRAAAQLGRNVHRLGAMLRERAETRQP